LVVELIVIDGFLLPAHMQACCSRLVAAELDAAAAAALARANKMRSHREEQKSEVVAGPGDSCRAGLNGFPSVPL
jgi:hypothetical protein